MKKGYYIAGVMFFTIFMGIMLTNDKRIHAQNKIGFGCAGNVIVGESC